MMYTVTAEDGSTKNYTVILTMDRYLYVGSYDGNLYALDAATGNLIWKFGTGGGIASSPTQYNGVIYFLSSDTYAYAVNAKTGSLFWKYQLPFGNPNTVYGSNPTVQAGIMYCNAPFYLVALDAAAGSLRWQTYIDPWSYDNSPTVVNGVVYNPTIGGGPVVAFDALSGSLIRSFSIGSGAANPVVVNGIVYGNYDSAILGAWDVHTGLDKIGFSAPIIEATSASSPTIYHGNIYFSLATGQFGNGALLALDANTGVLQWEFNTSPGGGISTPVAGGGMIFAFDNLGYFRALDAVTGAVKWSTYGTYTAALNATFANGTLYFGETNGSVNAVNAGTGLPKWSFQTGGMVIAGPCVVDVNGNVHHPTVSGDQQ